jgi:hypothetical protein
MLCGLVAISRVLSHEVCTSYNIGFVTGVPDCPVVFLPTVASRCLNLSFTPESNGIYQHLAVRLIDQDSAVAFPWTILSMILRSNISFSYIYSVRACIVTSLLLWLLYRQIVHDFSAFHDPALKLNCDPSSKIIPIHYSLLDIFLFLLQHENG